MIKVLRQRNFALLWIAGFISLAGDWTLIIAIPLYVFRQTGSTLATATALAASVLPGIVFGSVAGVFVDRWDRKKTMIWSDLIRIAIMAPLLFTSRFGGVWIVYVVAALESTAGLFFDPAKRSLLPKLVDQDQLVTANAISGSNGELARLAGPAIGATLFSAIGIGGIGAVNAATFLGSALLVRLITIDARPPAVERSETGLRIWLRVIHEWKEGLEIVRGSRDLMTVFTATALAMLQEGAFATLALAPFVLDVLGGTDRQVGWFASAQAIGGIIAGTLAGRFGHRLHKRLLYSLGVLGLGVTDLGVFNSHFLVDRGAHAVALAAGFMVLSGFPAVASGVGQTTLLQDLTDDRFRGRVFGALSAVQGVFMLIGLTIAGVLGNRVGIVAVLDGGCVMGIIGGAIALIRFARASAEPGHLATPDPA